MCPAVCWAGAPRLCDNRPRIQPTTLSPRTGFSMQVRSLAYRTDLMFVAFDGVLTDRGDYLVVRSPLSPSFYWGNFLMFPRAPQPGDFERWRLLFLREIGSPPKFEHQAFGWDGTDGHAGYVGPFVAAGFRLEHTVALTSGNPLPPRRPSTEISIRPLASDSDWAEACELQVLCREPEHEEGGYRRYRRDMIARYRKMEAQGLGHWYGAYIGSRLVADLGVFHDGRGLGRYQSVETHPDFRRRGIAGTLVYESGRRALAEHGLHTLVILAETDEPPARLYESVGFKPTEWSAGLVWFPRVGR